MKKKSDNNKYFLIGIVALVLVVILLDTRYTGFQTADTAPSEPPESLCVSGCMELLRNDPSLRGSCRSATDYCNNVFCVSSLPSCGNGQVEGIATQRADGSVVGCGPIREECDEGDIIDGDGCSSKCKIERCGNERLDFGEECDGASVGEGELARLRSCSSDCKLEPYKKCGRGRNVYETVRDPRTGVERERLAIEYACGRPRYNVVNVDTGETSLASPMSYPDNCKSNLLGAPFRDNQHHEVNSLNSEFLRVFYDEEDSNDCDSVAGEFGESGSRDKCMCFKGQVDVPCGVDRGDAACPDPFYDWAICANLNDLNNRHIAEAYDEAGTNPNPDLQIFSRGQNGRFSCMLQSMDRSQRCYCHRTTSPPGTASVDSGSEGPSTQTSSAYNSYNTMPSAPYNTYGNPMPSTPYDAYSNPIPTAPTTGGSYPTNAYSTPSTPYTIPTTDNSYSNNYPSTDTPYTVPANYDSYGNPITPYTTTQPTTNPAGNYMAPPNPIDCGNGICDIGTQYTLPEDSYSCPQDCSSPSTN